MRIPFRTLPLISLVTLASLLGPAMPARAISESTITVNTTSDELNNDGDCSLREAIQAANTNSPVDACPMGIGGDKIILPEGVYTLSRAGTDEDNNQIGDLDIRGNLVIQGAAQGLTIIDGGYIDPETYIDRVIHITGSYIAYVVEISHLTIQHGYASTGMLGGGAILNQGTLTLKSVTLKDNRAVNVGGAMDNYSGTASLDNSSISGNYSTKDGGGIFNDGQLSLDNSTVNENTAASGGGGLDNRGSGTIRNVTISSNTASAGGGMFNDGELFILYSSLVANTATADPPSEGGNIENAGSIRIKTTIVANSLAGPNCAGDGAIISEGHNLENTNTCNFNDPTDFANVVDPLVGPLADNEGPTLTHALLTGSLAIDAGEDVDCPEKDQRGANRPADGDGDEVAICDIGAFEYKGIFPEFVFIPLAVR